MIELLVCEHHDTIDSMATESFLGPAGSTRVGTIFKIRSRSSVLASRYASWSSMNTVAQSTQQ